MVNNPAELQALYEQFNERYFRRRLPRYRVRVSDSAPAHGECRPKSHLILLRPMEPELQRQVLLHEMCHIGTSGHGPRFKAKLQAVADQGEPYARRELEAIRAAPPWNLEMANLRTKLDEIAYLFPRWRFNQLLKWAAMTLGISPSEVREKVPWLKASWRTARREAAEDKHVQPR